MEVGNWKSQIIVVCNKCKHSMGFHVETTKAICNECKAKGSEESMR